MKYLRVFGVDSIKLFPECLISLFDPEIFQFRTKDFITFDLRIGSLKDERVDIEPCSSTEDRDL